MKKNNNDDISKIIGEKLSPLDELNPTPESLSPENITKKIEETKNSKEKIVPIKKTFHPHRWAAVAAAFVILIAGLGVVYKLNSKAPVISNAATQKTAAAEDYSKISDTIEKIKKDSGTSYRLSGTTEIAEAAKSASNSVNSGAAASYGKTNIQVDGVDEADILKNDGNYLYFIPQGSNVINIVNASSPEKMTLKSKIKTDNLQPTELYVSGNRLIVLCTGITQYRTPATEKSASSSAASYGSSGVYSGPAIRCYVSFGTYAVIYDISDKAHPKELKKLSQDGDYVSSRLIGGKLYLVSNYTVNLESVDKNKPETFVPTYSEGKSSPKAISSNNICIMKDADCANYAVVTAADINSCKITQQKAVLGGGQNIYCSNDSLLVASVNYRTASAVTNIIKFGLSNGNFSEAVSSSVSGSIKNQYSVDEYGGYFRIATTSYISSKGQNNIYILDGSLKTVGKIEGLAKGEQIQSVRFLGNKGYVVTFRQTDPLFAFDLSNPKSPKVLGQLKIPGFSSYLHPISESLLLGIGYDGSESGMISGMKISLFDVSDLSNPKEVSKYVIEDRNYSSIALTEPKAIQFFDSVTFGFPLSCSKLKGNTWKDISCYQVFTVSGNKIVKKGETSSSGSDGSSLILRGTYIGRTLYTAANSNVSSFSLDSFKKLGSLDLPYENKTTVVNPGMALK